MSYRTFARLEGNTMTSREAQQEMFSLNPQVTCVDCGVSHLDVFYRSSRDGQCLCPTCFQARGPCRMTEEGPLPLDTVEH